MNTYLWMDSRSENTPKIMARRLASMLEGKAAHRPLVLLCIGTPKIPGDSLGPSVGSLLSNDSRCHVYGTLDHPVHAMNLKATLHNIKKQHKRPLIIAIDAALGNENQSGFLTLKKGPLKPGKGLGKRLPAIGHIQITGVFHTLYGDQAQNQMKKYSQCIAQGLDTCIHSPSISYKN